MRIRSGDDSGIPVFIQELFNWNKVLLSYLPVFRSYPAISFLIKTDVAARHRKGASLPACSPKYFQTPRNTRLGWKADFYAVCIRTCIHLKELYTEIACTKTKRPLWRKPSKERSHQKNSHRSRVSHVIQQLDTCPWGKYLTKWHGKIFMYLVNVWFCLAAQYSFTGLTAIVS